MFPGLRAVIGTRTKVLTGVQTQVLPIIFSSYPHTSRNSDLKHLDRILPIMPLSGALNAEGESQ